MGPKIDPWITPCVTLTGHDPIAWLRPLNQSANQSVDSCSTGGSMSFFLRCAGESLSFFRRRRFWNLFCQSTTDPGKGTGPGQPKKNPRGTIPCGRVEHPGGGRGPGKPTKLRRKSRFGWLTNPKGTFSFKEDTEATESSSKIYCGKFACS